MHTLVARLAALAHGRHGFLFAQNGADVDGPFLRYLDGWNREDVGSDPTATGELRRMRARGLLTLATSYVADAKNSGAIRRDVRIACRAGALPFVSNLELTRIPARPPGTYSTSPLTSRTGGTLHSASGTIVVQSCSQGVLAGGPGGYSGRR